MIFQQSVWQYPNDNENEINALSQAINKEPLIAKLLYDRGIRNSEEAERFLNPQISDLHDPFLMLDMALACDRIKEAVARKEAIWIYGDYDVDGITSITILHKFFEYIEYPVSYYIPSRMDEGYGLSNLGLESIKSSGGDLVITVDCGITATEQATFAKSIGLDLIVTDHHECQETLPEAVAVINPKRGNYPFEMLAGCGVAFKLTQALLGPAFEDFYPKVIDIVALGTVADIVPLVDENRVFTKLGLERMMHTSNPGVSALIAEAQLTDKEINAGHIGFVIAPRINAAGRIGNPAIAVEMLLENDYYAALEIAKSLSALNQERQNQEREIMTSAEHYIQTQIDLNSERILLVVGENWHTGIIGIVASKLTEKYARPAVVLNVEDGVAKGSARSIEGISIFGVLSQFKSFFDKFGGHDQAAGLSLEASKVEALKEALKGFKVPYRSLVHTQKVSAPLKPQMVTHALLESIELLKPFGMGNPKPLFVFNDLTIEDYRVIGKGQNHLKMVVNDTVRVYDALAFNQAELVNYIRKRDTVHLLLTLETNHFMGVETIQFMVKDLVKDKMPLKPLLMMRAHDAIFDFIVSGDQVPKKEHVKPIESLEWFFQSDERLNEKKPLFVYDFSVLMGLKDALFQKNEMRYAIHFRTLDPEETESGLLDIVFMPTVAMSEAFKEHYVLKADELDNRMVEYVPKREDLVYFYKQIQNINEVAYQRVPDLFKMSFTKLKLCLELLQAMDLLTYSVFNEQISIAHKDKPKEKKPLETLKLYQFIISNRE